MSVAFEDQGEMVPMRGTTQSSRAAAAAEPAGAPSSDRSSRTRASSSGPAARLLVHEVDVERFELGDARRALAQGTKNFSASKRRESGATAQASHEQSARVLAEGPRGRKPGDDRASASRPGRVCPAPRAHLARRKALEEVSRTR